MCQRAREQYERFQSLDPWIEPVARWRLALTESGPIQIGISKAMSPI
jgi:hypothetical protein